MVSERWLPDEPSCFERSDQRMSIHSIRCRKYGHAIADRLDGGECVCKDKCLVPLEGLNMELSFNNRIEWDEKGAIIPQLTDAEIEEVLRVYRPHRENRICYCQGNTVCPYCMLTQVIDQLRRRLKWSRVPRGAQSEM